MKQQTKENIEKQRQQQDKKSTTQQRSRNKSQAKERGTTRKRQKTVPKEEEKKQKVGCCDKINLWITTKSLQIKQSEKYKELIIKWKKFKQFLGLDPPDYQELESLSKIPFKPIEMQLGECKYTLDLNKIKEPDFNQLSWDYNYSNTRQEDDTSSEDSEDENAQVEFYKEKIKEYKQKYRQELQTIEKNSETIEKKEKELTDTKVKSEFLIQKLAVVQNRIAEMKNLKEQI